MTEPVPGGAPDQGPPRPGSNHTAVGQPLGVGGRLDVRDALDRHPIARPLPAIGMVVLAALAAFAFVRAFWGGDSPAPTSTASATTVVAPDVSVTQPGVPKGPEGKFRGAPALRIHPQRAAAGSPLELTVEGVGCPGRSGLLSITEMGSATQTGGVDRLVVRRRFDVDTDHRFSAAPLLVGQPPGSYRVSIACDRYASALLPEQDRGREVFALTEVLELTGPMAAREFTVSPTSATPGMATSFALAGRGCIGADARVEVRVFPPSAMDAGPLNVLHPPLANGSWQSTFTVIAPAADGTYTFDAVCYDASGQQFDYVSRHVHFGPLTLAIEPQPSRFEGVFDALGIHAKPTAAAATQAVDGTPRYTG